MTLITLSDPSKLELLRAELASHPDIVVDIVGVDRLELSVLGSYDIDAMRLTTLLRLRAWEAAQRASGADVSVELE
jgi:hypothetical protein